MVAKAEGVRNVNAWGAGPGNPLEYLQGQGKNFFAKLDRHQLDTQSVPATRASEMDEALAKDAGDSIVSLRLPNGPGGEHRSVVVMDNQVWGRTEPQASTFGRSATWFLINKRAPQLPMNAGLPKGLVPG